MGRVSRRHRESPGDGRPGGWCLRLPLVMIGEPLCWASRKQEGIVVNHKEVQGLVR